MKYFMTILMEFAFSATLFAGGKDPESLLKDYTAREVVAFARQFEGIRYDYANSDPLRGFDCSGFVNFIFSYFNIKVPRTSSQFSNAGKDVSIQDAKQGDIILFKGSSLSGGDGHLGIVTENKGGVLYFIHSATSQSRGIMISNTSENYFNQRLVKVIRVI